MNESEKIEKDKKRFNKWLLLGIGGFIVTYVLMPFLMTLDVGLPSFIGTGPVGDTIGGIIGPIVGAIGAILTFLAFREQYLANQRQWEVINEQKEDAEMDRFRNQFFELLKMLREDTAKIKIKTINGELSGNEAILAMILKLKSLSDSFLANIKKKQDEENSENPETANPIELCRFFYGLLYHGTSIEGKASEYLTKEHVKSHSHFSEASIRDFIAKANLDGLEHDLVHEMKDKPSVNASNIPSEYGFYHGLRPHLSGYFRLLFRIAEFHFNFSKTRIARETKEKKFVPGTEDPRSKKELDSLGELLRTQLSDEAQILLYFNCMMSFGKEWWKRKYLQKYAFLKNAAWHMLPDELHPDQVVGFMGSHFAENPQEAMQQARGIKKNTA